MSVKDPFHELEGNRAAPFTKKRRDRCVQRIMKETGIGEYEATIAYRIATCGLVGAHRVEEVENDGMDS